MSNENETKSRMVIYGTTGKKEADRTLLVYNNEQGDNVQCWIPNIALEDTISLPTGENAFIVKNEQIDGGMFNINHVFSGPRAPGNPLISSSLHKEIRLMVNEGVASQNIRAWMKDNTSNQSVSTLASTLGEGLLSSDEVVNFDGLGTPATNDGLGMPAPIGGSFKAPPVVGGFANNDGGDPGPDPDDDSNDDSDPTSNFNAQKAVHKLEDAQSGGIKLQPVVKWVDGVDANGNAVKKAELVDLTDTAWGGALLQGDRYEKSVPWRFEADKKPVWVRTSYDPSTGEGTFARVNKEDGTPASYALLNPSRASENRGAGAWLGNVGSNYHILNHKTIFDPIIEHAKQAGVKTWVTSYNDGKQARLDLDVSQATQTRQLAAQRLKENGHSYLSQSGLDGMINKVDGLYKFGFAINNGVDGKSALHVDMMSLRTYCQNLAAVGGIESIARMRHLGGVMGDIDWDAWGKSMVDVVAEAQSWLATTELMSWIPLDTQLFERLQTLSEKHKLMSFPKVTWGQNKTDGANISQGYMWRVLGQGWLNHDAPHVKVGLDEKHTMYHALQTYTGAYTHKPEWQSNDGKQVMKGTSHGFDTLRRRLHGVSNMFDGLVTSSLDAYMKEAGVDKIDLDMKADCMNFIANNPDVIKVPDKKGNLTNQLLMEIPTASYALGLSDNF